LRRAGWSAKAEILCQSSPVIGIEGSYWWDKSGYSHSIVEGDGRRMLVCRFIGVVGTTGKVEQRA